MDEQSPPPSKKNRTMDDVASLSKDELIKKCQKQQERLELLQSKCNSADDSQEKFKSSEPTRRENVLIMRLANKEQELQEYLAQINHNKKVQEDAAILSLRQTNLDPGINLLFGKMREELQQTKSKLEQAQNELSAWKFTPDSQNGKKLISRCRTLIAENQELGRQLSHGKAAQLEAELALQKKYSEELKASQDELNEFVIQLDEEVEGMQSTIQVLQIELAAAKNENEDYKKTIEAYETNMNFKDEAPFEDIKMDYNDRTPGVSEDNSAKESDNDADFENANYEQTSELSYDINASRRTSSHRSYDNSDKETDPEKSNYFQEINSPGTPTSERNITRTSRFRTPDQVPPNSDVIDDVTAHSIETWDERTSDVSGESIVDDEIEIEVENEEVATSSYESEDDIGKSNFRAPSSRTPQKSDPVENQTVGKSDKLKNDICSPILNNDERVAQAKKDKIVLSPNSESHTNDALNKVFHSATNPRIDLPDKSTLLTLIANHRSELEQSVDVDVFLTALQKPEAFENISTQQQEILKRISEEFLMKSGHDVRTEINEGPDSRPCGTTAVNNHAHEPVNGIAENSGVSN